MKSMSTPPGTNTTKQLAILVATLVGFAVTTFAQANGAAGAAGTNGTAAGTALGTAAFHVTTTVLFRKMKEPDASIGIGPRRLDFNGVSLNKIALNVVTITNGTSSTIDIESLLISPSGFGLASPLAFPLAIPPQTQALLTVKFLPTRIGNFSGAVEVRYRLPSNGSLHKMGITLRGKGVQE